MMFLDSCIVSCKIVLLRISRSCKLTDLGGSIKNLRIRFWILDESITNLCIQTCGLISVHQMAANGVNQYLSQKTSTAMN